ncbi:hypothetical protein PINS_up010718 [Pythium insidiosum]|nr:hypothetical protein PINS_up010718 [Pythium insidiosum]
MQIFHHASAQTLLTRARRNYGPRAYRETQTQELTTRSVQTRRESGTQMERHDLRLDSSRDRVLTAKPYFDSYQLQCLREDSVLLIQRLWRGFKARAYVHSLRDQRRRVAAMNQLEAQENAIQDADHQKREVQRRMHPKTVGDFEVLYNELDKWRQVETRKLQEDRTLSEDERQQAMESILAKETKLLQTIDRLKLTANDSNRKQRIESMLQFMSRPKQWQMSDGGVKEVHTPFTIRAKELTDLYHGLKLSLASVDERLDVLLNVKWTVKEFDCALTREIIELIDREADMLSRGRKKESLEGLRKRLTNLFLQFIENPEFNPEAAALKYPKPT